MTDAEGPHGSETRPRRARQRVLLVLGAIAVLTCFAVVLVKGEGPNSGELLVPLTADNGVNSGDIPVFVLWLVGVGCCLGLLRR